MEWSKYSNFTWIEDAPYSYDALWAVALMLNKTLQVLEQRVFANGAIRRLEEFTYADYEMAEVFFETLKETDFYGMSVSSYFSCVFIVNFKMKYICKNIMFYHLYSATRLVTSYTNVRLRQSEKNVFLHFLA